MKKIILLLILLASFQLFADKPGFAATNFFENTGNRISGVIKGNSSSMAQADAYNNLHNAKILKITGKSLLGIGAGFTFLGTVLACLDPTISLPFIIPGPIALVAGAIILPVGIKREKKAKVELENLSVTPTKGGMFTTIGLRF